MIGRWYQPRAGVGHYARGERAHRHLKPSRSGAAQFVVLDRDKDQHDAETHEHAPGGVLPVPGRALPHQEPLRTHRDERGEPLQQRHAQAINAEGFCGVKLTRRRLEFFDHLPRAQRTERARRRLPRDDGPVKEVVKPEAPILGRGIGDGAPALRLAREKRIHAEHMVHKRVVRRVVEDRIVEHDDEKEKRRGGEERDLNETGGEHGDRSSSIPGANLHPTSSLRANVPSASGER